MKTVYIDHEQVVRVGDPTRIVVSKIFSPPGEALVTKIEICPIPATSPDPDVYYDVTTNLDDLNRPFLDWIYDTDETVTVKVKITDADTDEFEREASIVVVAVDDDVCFSDDQDLIEIEGSIKTYLREGRSSFIDKHRRAKDEILHELDSKRIWKEDGSKYVIADIVDLAEFNEWSKYLVLKNIFTAEINQPDDLYQRKANIYDKRLQEAKGKSFYRLDLDGDGVQDESEKEDNFSGSILRR